MSPHHAHPVLTSHDDTRIAWQQACTQAADALRPQHDRERLAKALALAHEGAVTLDDDDAALVTSHGTRYRIDADGPCLCPDMHNRGVPCKHLLAVQIHRQATAALASSTRVAPPPGTAEADRRPSADRWDVHEAPASACLRLRVGELEILYTMRDVTDAELTSRVQYLVPWVQDLVEQARERQAHLAALRQQREAASAGQTAVPQPPPSTPPAALQALIQQAVQQALAAQQSPSHGHASANGHAPEDERPAVADDWCDLHQVTMERRSNARGSWWSHWIASEKRYCKGKA